MGNGLGDGLSLYWHSVSQFFIPKPLLDDLGSKVIDDSMIHYHGDRLLDFLSQLLALQKFLLGILICGREAFLQLIAW